MKAILHFLILLSLATGASARVGETTEEIQKRYGEGKKVGDRLNGPGVGTWMYSKGGMTIEVVLHNNLSIWEIYKRDDKVITNEDIETLLKIYDTSKNNWRFDRGDNTWVRTGKPKLIGYRWPGHEDYFCIKDVDACKVAEKGSKIDASGL